MQKRKQEKIKEMEEKQQMRSKSVLQTGGKKKKANNDVGHFLSNYGKVTKNRQFFFYFSIPATKWFPLYKCFLIKNI